MDDEKTSIKVLKWLGIAALIAVPLAVFLKKRKPQETFRPNEEDDIFAAELEE